MNARESWQRAERVRDALGNHLDEIEKRFGPSHLMKMSGFVLRRSLLRHPVGWRVAAGSVAALLAGLVVWAIVSDDEDDAS